jgi:cytochrome c-type biogenesis protein CcmH/NrfG
MTSYEFWEELNKVFNAVVSYQEKSIEFNKKFITPWIRLGNVFDKNDRQRESIAAYKQAVEMDPDNAQLWFELGNLYLNDLSLRKRSRHSAVRSN